MGSGRDALCTKPDRRLPDRRPRRGRGGDLPSWSACPPSGAIRPSLGCGRGCPSSAIGSAAGQHKRVGGGLRDRGGGPAAVTSRNKTEVTTPALLKAIRASFPEFAAFTARSCKTCWLDWTRLLSLLPS